MGSTHVRNNDSFFDTVLFIEAAFTNHGNINLHNMHTEQKILISLNTRDNGL